MELKSEDVTLAQLNDAHAIATISRDLIEYGLPWSWTPPRVARAILDADTNCVVIKHSDTVSAFAIAVFSQNNVHLHLLAVQSEFQQRGAGKQLVLWLEKVALTAGIQTLSLEVRENNEAARAFYRSLGYRETGLLKFYYNGHESALSMIHHL